MILIQLLESAFVIIFLCRWVVYFSNFFFLICNKNKVRVHEKSLWLSVDRIKDRIIDQIIFINVLYCCDLLVFCNQQNCFKITIHFYKGNNVCKFIIIWKISNSGQFFNLICYHRTRWFDNKDETLIWKFFPFYSGINCVNDSFVLVVCRQTFTQKLPICKIFGNYFYFEPKKEW